MYKVAVVVQGDCRGVTSRVIDFYKKRSDLVIYSTWQDVVTKQILPDSQTHIIKSKYPLNPGGTNRNYQRFSTIKGLKLAKKLKCTHVLKIRSDMVMAYFYPRIWIFMLEKINKKFISTPYRCATSKPDFLSSICDYFNFGKVDDMLELWRIDNLKLDKEYQLPSYINKSELDFTLNTSNYCAESELYALFTESNICRKLDLKDHLKIIRKFFILIPISLLGIVWFENKNSFRTIFPGSEHPWWNIYNYYFPPIYFYPNYKYKKNRIFKLKKFFYKLVYKIDYLYQLILINLLKI